MKETPTCYTADDCCVDCGKGVSPHQANTSKNLTFMSRALGDSRNRDGFVLCRSCLDRETRAVRVRDKVFDKCSQSLIEG